MTLPRPSQSRDITWYHVIFFKKKIKLFFFVTLCINPLHLSDCFPFEGWFKNTKTLHNGTRNISGQIASSLNLKLKVHFELKDHIFTKQDLKLFVEKISHNTIRKKTFINEPVFTKNLNSFPIHEQELRTKRSFQLSSTSSINFSHKALINNISNTKFYLIFWAFFTL